MRSLRVVGNDEEVPVNNNGFHFHLILVGYMILCFSVYFYLAQGYGEPTTNAEKGGRGDTRSASTPHMCIDA